MYTKQHFIDDCAHLYGTEQGEATAKSALALAQTIASRRKEQPIPSGTEATIVCYANSVVADDSSSPSLTALKEFFHETNLQKAFDAIHILPFYPWDTDRGFSVMDYRSVSPDYGTWEDCESLAEDFQVMYDFVVNHASIDNPLVQNALLARHLSEGHAQYEQARSCDNFVIAFSKNDAPMEAQLEQLVRPRAFPVLSSYAVYEQGGVAKACIGDTPKGARVLGDGVVWTTFSREQNADGTHQTRQVDLNFRSPKLFLEVLQILFFYAEHQASFIRLDAIGYIWKNFGSTSLHEPEAHMIIRALSFLLRQACSDILTIAEVNEHQEQSYSYLGTEEFRECDLTYQFTHFPLALHALQSADATSYIAWLRSTESVQGRQFITVLGSHDGVGMKAVRGVLSDSQVDSMVSVLVDDHGGLPNYGILPGGKKIVYEVCATPWQLINNVHRDESFDVRLRRYLAVVNLGLLVRGMPAIYFNGLFGAKNYVPEHGLDENRTVNRESFPLSVLQNYIGGEDAELQAVFAAVVDLFCWRREIFAFQALQKPVQVLDIENKCLVFAKVPSLKSEDDIFLLQNLSYEAQAVGADLSNQFGQSIAIEKASPGIDERSLEELPAYGAIWLR